MKRIIAILYFLMFICIVVPGQELNETYDADQMETIPAPSDTNSDLNPNHPNKKFDFGMTVGTGFTFSPRNFYGPSYYVAPGFTYMATPRLSFSAGIAAEYATFYPLYNESAIQDKMLPMTRAFLYASGSYLLSARLAVHGIVYKTLIDMPRLSEYNSAYHSNYQGVGVGVDYKISNSFSVGFQMRLQQNPVYPYYEIISPPGFIPDSGF